MPTAAYTQYGEDRTPDRGGRILTTTLLPARRAADAEVGSRKSLLGDYRMILLDVGLVLIALLDAWLRLRWVKAEPEGMPEVPFHSEWLSWISAGVLIGRRRFPFAVALLTIPGFFTGFAQLAAMIALYTV
ncbi:MAG TPA: hypothetical protein VF821_03080, partial [Lentzea sp.]